MERSICIHGHFYQPPRENPWLEEIELQDSAAPYHDWNAKITAECYAPNTASRILNSDRRIEDIVNNYSRISFNFGPTLLSWLEKHNPEVYQVIIDADKQSRENFSGHGSAIAQCYNHMIMPLANRRDKYTQIIWGIKDFEHRFVRKPEGMWLPETAVDLETLSMLAEQGIKFTVLSPHQARRIKKMNDNNWVDVARAKIDPKIPYLCTLPCGKTIAIFFFDGQISRDIAFGGLLSNGENLAGRLISLFDAKQPLPQLAHIATDGESYGHHHRFGEMALSYCLYCIELSNIAGITIYGEYLEKNPPAYEVEIYENTSWSCAHGVERWRGNCGCNINSNPGWKQLWRGPLRVALDWLRDNLSKLYRKETLGLLADGWQARDDYIAVVLDRSTENVERFLAEHKSAGSELSVGDKVKILRLLEMQRQTMLMYTSCGWFFDEVSGIETVQIIRYAARAIQLAKQIAGVELEGMFVDLLKLAPGNTANFKTAAEVYEILVKPEVSDLLRVGMHCAVSSLFSRQRAKKSIYCYSVNISEDDYSEFGEYKLSVGRMQIHSDITWEERDIMFSAAHFGKHDFLAGVKDFPGDETFRNMRSEMKSNFNSDDISGFRQAVKKYFGHEVYSLWHLFKDDQRMLLDRIFDSAVKEIESSARQIFEHHYPLMLIVNKINFPLPKSFVSIAAYILSKEICQILEAENIDMERLRKIAGDIHNFSLNFADRDTVRFVASRRIERLMEDFYRNDRDLSLLESIGEILKILDPLSLNLDLWKAQNLYFAIGKKRRSDPKQRDAAADDPQAKKWAEHFYGLRDYLKLSVA